MDEESRPPRGAVAPGVRVCPDCGSQAGAQPFCLMCGRNLSMLERLPTRAEWEQDGASATGEPLDEAAFARTVAKALASIRPWFVPLDESRSFQDPAVRDRLTLSIQDHVAEAIEHGLRRELPIDIVVSLENDKRAYLAASVLMAGERAIEQRFAASIGLAGGHVQQSRANTLCHRIDLVFTALLFSQSGSLRPVHSVQRSTPA